MRKNIFRQLYDKPNGVNWGSLLYLHGTVDLLSKTSDKPTSDISPKLFAETLIEVVGKSHLVQMKKDQLSASGVASYANPLLSDFKAATIVLQPSDVVNFFEQAMNSSDIHTTVNGNRDETAIYLKLVSQVENWYVEMMQRLSMWYKKKVRRLLLIIGSILALIINVDSVQLFSHFNNNASSRTVMMNYYEANAERLNNLAKQTNNNISPDSIQGKLNYYRGEMESLMKEASLPIGWDYSYINPGNKNRGSFFWKLVGIIMSGFAASFGAPFWFELLKKVYTRKNFKA